MTTLNVGDRVKMTRHHPLGGFLETLTGTIKEIHGEAPHPHASVEWDKYGCASLAHLSDLKPHTGESRSAQ